MVLKRDNLTPYAAILLSPVRERLQWPHAALPQLERAPLFLRRAALPEAISGGAAVRLLNYMVL